MGLRPGEKLYEELLIGEHTTTTEHPRILKSDEPFLSPADLGHEIDLLKAAMGARDLNAIQATLLRTVEGYRPDGDAALGESALSRPIWGSASRTLH
jgi:FlaA1/EpsC-like NDP-sugar epimerase